MGVKGARIFSNGLKQEAVRRLEGGERAAAVAADFGIRPKLLYDWWGLYRRLGLAGLNRKRGRRRVWNGAVLASFEPSSLSDAGPSAAKPADELAQAARRIAELEGLVGRQQADLHFFREALRLWDATGHDSGAPTSTRSSKR